jgi:hypothetical protein
MGNPGCGGCIRPRRQNAEVPIDLQAVGVDDDGVEPFGQFERER